MLLTTLCNCFQTRQSQIFKRSIDQKLPVTGSVLCLTSFPSQDTKNNQHRGYKEQKYFNFGKKEGSRFFHLDKRPEQTRTGKIRGFCRKARILHLQRVFSCSSDWTVVLLAQLLVSEISIYQTLELPLKTSLCWTQNHQFSHTHGYLQFQETVAFFLLW